MDPSEDHNNWITVGELIRLIKEPVALCTSQIVENWHEEMCSRLLSGECTNPAVCQTKTNPGYLCLSCKRWYDELAKSYRNNDKQQIKWRENCDTSKWPVDPWEVAKFFMPILGDNKKNIKDAKSTGLSSLLNVLTWMKNAAFAPDIHVDLNLVTKLCSEVRNPWAHAPNQELPEAILIDAFDIANKFVADLDKVFSHHKFRECIEDINVLQANGLTSVKETKLKIVNLGLIELGGDVSQLKEKIKSLEEDESSERQLIKELKKLENLKKELRSLQRIVNSQGTDERSRVKSCIPEKPQTFIGRDTEVKQIISLLVENGCGIVSIVGGPGFGKSYLSIAVSHHLNNEHDIVVIFSDLSKASAGLKVMRRLCHDVGVCPGKDPESSLMLWVKDIERKVILVMDNVEQLLESNVESEFTDLLRMLRKNSRQHIQILTTTRNKFSIPDEATVINVQIGELDEKSSVELLRKRCPNEKVEDTYLSELTKLCGFVPLALSIAGKLIPDFDDDPDELIQLLREKPMEALQYSNQCIRKTIELSFLMLKDEDKKALVRLSVFDGNFQKKSAQEVIDRDRIKTLKLLENLDTRSLIQKRNDKRFVIHSLIRRFLADQLHGEKTMARGLMVRHFLEMCHMLTMNSYSFNGFSGARESLKKDAHNVEETLLIICSQDQATNPNSNILELLANSNIYNFSSRFFYDFGWDLLPETLLRNFFECCIKLAKSLNQPAIEITFQCLVADQEGRKYGWGSLEYTNRRKTIKEMFHTNEVTLKKDRYLFGFCYYSIARYEAEKTTTVLPVDDLASLPVNKASSPIEKVAETLILRERGHLNKKRANKMYPIDKKKYEEYMNCAKSLYNEALLLAKELLGDHELTCTLHKLLGDLLFNWRKNEEALAYYHDAIKLRKKLKLDSNEQFVFLLKNYGTCLSFSKCCEESVEKLKEARDIADKLTDKHTPLLAKVYSQLARVYHYWKLDRQEAAEYARTGIEMQGLLHPREVTKLQEIIEWAAENVS